MAEPYRYQSSVKTHLSDELLNTYLLRPIAGVIVRAVRHTPVTPSQVTAASILTGFVAALFYVQRGVEFLLLGGLLVTAKDILDSADGQLARATGRFSRAGRFLDSIGDFAVNAAVFGAIGWRLWQIHDQFWWLPAAAGAFLGTTLRVSYHVFYQVSYLHLEGKYGTNRIVEEITEDDRHGDRWTLTLQRLFLALYGWQDRLLFRLDAWCGQGVPTGAARREWYSDPLSLRLSSFLGIGTELFLLMLFSVFDALEAYLAVNIAVLNTLLVGCIWYRRVVVRNRLLVESRKERGDRNENAAG